MATKINRPATAFVTTSGKKRPRDKQDDHLSFIRTLPCLICGATRDIQAAHIRYGSALHGKPITGVGTKPDDKWTVPLCERHHLTGPDAQHKFGEHRWWQAQRIDPIMIAALLYCHSGDHDSASLVATNAKSLFQWIR